MSFLFCIVFTLNSHHRFIELRRRHLLWTTCLQTHQAWVGPNRTRCFVDVCSKVSFGISSRHTFSIDDQRSFLHEYKSKRCFEKSKWGCLQSSSLSPSAPYWKFSTYKPKWRDGQEYSKSKRCQFSSSFFQKPKKSKSNDTKALHSASFIWTRCNHHRFTFLAPESSAEGEIGTAHRSAHGYSTVVGSAAEISRTNKAWAFHFELLLVLLIQPGGLVLDRDLHDYFNWPYPTCRKGRTIGLGWIMACAHIKNRPQEC